MENVAVNTAAIVGHDVVVETTRLPSMVNLWGHEGRIAKQRRHGRAGCGGSYDWPLHNCRHGFSCVLQTSQMR